MRVLPLVLLLFAIAGCGSPTPPEKSPAEPSLQQKVAAIEKEAANDITKELAERAAAVEAAVANQKQMLADQLAMGDPVVNTIGMVMVPIPAGQFQMGTPNSRLDRTAQMLGMAETLHPVKITKPFWLAAHEVTQQQFVQVMEMRPWKGEVDAFEGDNYPATYVSWNGAVEFCRKLSEQEGVEYRLPTEAEWEYACRAGTVTVFSFGDDPSKLAQYASESANPSVHPVGQKLPNPLGLFDMHGNAWEWCQDWKAPYSSGKIVNDPTGPLDGDIRVARGGGARYNNHWLFRSAMRGGSVPNIQDFTMGLRVARTYETSR